MHGGGQGEGRSWQHGSARNSATCFGAPQAALNPPRAAAHSHCEPTAPGKEWGRALQLEGAVVSPPAVRGRATVGCSLRHPQPRGDLRIAAHTRPTADCPQGRSRPGPLPGRPGGTRQHRLGAHSDLVSPLTVGSRLDPSPSPERRGSPQAAHVRPGSTAARGGRGSSRRRRKSFGQTRHPRWLSGCPLSGSDRVIPKPSLSEGQILPRHRSPLLALGDCGGPGRACQGTAVAGSSCSISRPAPPRCRWPHPHCGQQPGLPLGTLTPAVSPQEASFCF